MPPDILQEAIRRLATSAVTFEGLCAGVEAETSRWKPTPEQWSMREVMGHLWDEESHDFRARLRLTLENPEADWPALNPPQRVLDLAFNEKPLEELVGKFRAERGVSLEWLRSLEAPEFGKTHHHPRGFSLSAGALLAAWVAHDLIHVRQLTRLLYQSWEAAQPYSLEYAGPW